MADRIGLNIQAGLNIAQSTMNIEQQIKKIQDALKPLNININEKILTQAFDKVSNSINVAAGGATQLEKNIINITTDTGQLVKITQTYDDVQKKILVSGINVENNLKAQAIAANKVAEAMKQSQQTINDSARKMIVDEENKRISITTEAQKRIEQQILGSNQTISEQQKRINSVNANNYEQVWLRAFQRIEAEEQKLANQMGKMNEQSQARVSTQSNRSDLVQNTAINSNMDSVYAQAQKEAEARIRAQQEVSDVARRLIVEEESQRVSTTTEAQRRIEQLVTGSNQTIAEQQQRMNSTNAFNYEQVWQRAYQQQAQAEEQLQVQEQRNVETERQRSAELQRQIALYQEQNAIQLRNIQSQYGSLARTPAIQSQIGAVQGTVAGLSSSVLDAEGFRTQSAQVNTAISGIRANLNEARAASNNFGSDLAHNALKMMEWTVRKLPHNRVIYC